mmetsp:Transcript_37187/g.61953  ORF Transcript_37187/g.61953 Transcript_37187/m.61953 type:complete len:103 (-) Transcript_37187:216-524(-)
MAAVPLTTIEGAASISQDSTEPTVKPEADSTEEKMTQCFTQLEQTMQTFTAVATEGQALKEQLAAIRAGEAGGDPALRAELNAALQEIESLKRQLVAEQQGL